MVPWQVASHLKWLRADALAKYWRILDHFHALQHTASELDRAEMHIKLGEPLKGIEILRATETNETTATIRKQILLARALWSMRMPHLGACLLFKSCDIYTSYDLCLELARLNYILGINARKPLQVKEDLEAAASTLKHCIRLDPNRPEAYSLHACIAAPYAEWRDLVLDYYHRFEEVMSQTEGEISDWFMLMDAFYVNRNLGRLEEARQWLERLQQLLNSSPWLGDRFAFHALAHAFRRLGNKALYEENLQCAWLLYPSKGGDLVRAYARRGRLFRVIQMFCIAYHNTDLREYRWRLAFAKAKGGAARQMLADLTGLSF
jgi:tetratricopeptide (TPR) repeat protein